MTPEVKIAYHVMRNNSNKSGETHHAKLVSTGWSGARDYGRRTCTFTIMENHVRPKTRPPRTDVIETHFEMSDQAMRDFVLRLISSTLRPRGDSLRDNDAAMPFRDALALLAQGVVNIVESERRPSDKLNTFEAGSAVHKAMESIVRHLAPRD